VPRHIALLRGVNLARNRRVKMADLRDALARNGYEDARTFLQSGNVVLTSRAKPERLQRELERLIAGELGIETSVVVRTRDELADVIARDPFGDAIATPKWYQVTFLAAEPDPEFARELAAADVAPEQVVVSGREIYAWHPEGLQRSPLAKLLSDKRLGPGATARNWNTVLGLLELADGS
jgi:uncharacterized protein (DUF1697 family)